MENTYWRKCGSCKKEIFFNTIYQVCSVSSCNKLVFCSVNCWDQHNPIMNHKSAWAEEHRSPKKEEGGGTPQDTHRRVIVTTKQPHEAPKSSLEQENDVLIVASKLKAYVKEKYDLNTSAGVMEVLSDRVRRLTDQAVSRAKSEGRKTLMDRDFGF